MFLAEHWLGVTDNPADLDGDGDVDGADFALLADNWLKKDSAVVISEFMALNGSKPPLVQENSWTKTATLPTGLRSAIRRTRASIWMAGI